MESLHFELFTDFGLAAMPVYQTFQFSLNPRSVSGLRSITVGKVLIRFNPASA
jgi:hypothetical protein